jgi:hypothetical protein
MLFMERSALTISGSICLRDFRAFPIHRGGMFARNLRNPRTAEPELDKKSLASLAMPLASSFLRVERAYQEYCIVKVIASASTNRPNDKERMRGRVVHGIGQAACPVDSNMANFRGRVIGEVHRTVYWRGMDKIYPSRFHHPVIKSEKFVAQKPVLL